MTATPPHTVTAIIPARNEAPCIAAVVCGLRAQRGAAGRPLIDEVLVADNGSSDGTALAARRAGARVVEVPQVGYGRACWEAVRTSSGEVLLFVDGDGAADPGDAPRLLAAIGDGADLVVGLRIRPDPGAMTLPQRFGNALACALMRQLWRMPARDLGPYRAIRRTAFDHLDLRDRGFGWTVEMQVRAHTLGLQVAQLPVAWHARSGGRSKISGILGMVARLWWQERRRAPQKVIAIAGVGNATQAPVATVSPRHP